MARVAGPWGVKGEVKVQLLTDFPERLAHVSRLWLGDRPDPLRLQRYRRRGATAILKFWGIEDRNAAEGLRGELLAVAIEDAAPLGEGQYYEHQILQITVVTDRGEKLGRIVEILRTGANDVYRVSDGEQERLIPAVEGVVLEVDTDRGRLVVSLPQEEPHRPAAGDSHRPSASSG